MNHIKTMVFSALFAICSSSFAEVAVIVSATNNNGSIDKASIAKIFLGKSKSFPDGSPAVPIDHNDGAASRDLFNDAVLGKSASQLKSYWSRLIFTGKGKPPEQSGSDAEIKALVAGDASKIGYIDAAAVDSSVKVVLKF